MTAVRLEGGTPVPPAPSLGSHRPVTAAGHHLGAIVETHLSSHVPVCSHPTCQAALEPRVTEHLAVGGLYRHWDTAHPGEPA